MVLEHLIFLADAACCGLVSIHENSINTTLMFMFGYSAVCLFE